MRHLMEESRPPSVRSLSHCSPVVPNESFQGAPAAGHQGTGRRLPCAGDGLGVGIRRSSGTRPAGSDSGSVGTAPAGLTGNGRAHRGAVPTGFPAGNPGTDATGENEAMYVAPWHGCARFHSQPDDPSATDPTSPQTRATPVRECLLLRPRPLHLALRNVRRRSRGLPAAAEDRHQPHLREFVPGPSHPLAPHRPFRCCNVIASVDSGLRRRGGCVATGPGLPLQRHVPFAPRHL